MTELVVEPVRILGVCSSPRRASTLYCLERALGQAKAAGADLLGMNPTIAAGLEAEEQA